MPRVFAGISTTLDLSRELKNWRHEFDNKNINEKWTHKTDYHMTLAFLGSAEESQLEKIQIALDQVAARHNSFSFLLDEFATFPEPKDAHVFFAGSTKKSSELLSLAEDVRNELTFQNIPFDPKPFLPHVTLSRIKKGIDLRHRIKRFNRQLIEVKSIVLFATRPSDEVPRYEKLSQFEVAKRLHTAIEDKLN